MYIILSIIFGTILGFLLLMLGPVIGGCIAFGIVVGCLFRVVYQLNNISKSLQKISLNPEKEEIVYQETLVQKVERPHYLKDGNSYLKYRKDKERNIQQ
jgi:hypothetical protein